MAAERREVEITVVVVARARTTRHSVRPTRRCVVSMYVSSLQHSRLRRRDTLFQCALLALGRPARAIKILNYTRRPDAVPAIVVLLLRRGKGNSFCRGGDYTARVRERESERDVHENR